MKDIETIKKDIVEKITDYMCEVAQKHYEFNDITFEEMSDLMEKELATKLNEIREEVIGEMMKAIKIDPDSVYYRYNPPTQMAINEYINEIFNKVQTYLTTKEDKDVS